MMQKVAKDTQRRAKANRLSLWYGFEEMVEQHENKIGLWYRLQPSEPAVEYTWRQTYEQSCKWARFLQDNGVQSGELVGTYLINSPEFMFNLLGSWAIGSAPAMINYNLGGDGLVHCLKVAGSKVLIVDSAADCVERIEEQRERIENELGMRIIILDDAVKATIDAYEPIRPDNIFRDNLSGEFPIFLFYTSGTTGHPKACPFQTQRAYALGQPRLQTTGLKPGDRWYDCMPLYHGTGCTVAIGCMLTGVTL